jgi:hypothetical protein
MDFDIATLDKDIKASLAANIEEASIEFSEHIDKA